MMHEELLEGGGTQTEEEELVAEADDREAHQPAHRVQHEQRPCSPARHKPRQRISESVYVWRPCPLARHTHRNSRQLHAR